LLILGLVDLSLNLDAARSQATRDFKSENTIANIKRVSAQIPRLLLIASFLGCTKSNKAAILGESLENSFLVNLPTEIPENPLSDMSKNATFPTSQQASEVREPYLSTDNSLGPSEDTHNTSTSLAFGLDAPKQFYDQWFGSEYQPVAEQGLNVSIPFNYAAMNCRGTLP
jgi:hypothetical protein